MVCTAYTCNSNIRDDFALLNDHKDDDYNNDDQDNGDYVKDVCAYVPH